MNLYKFSTVCSIVLFILFSACSRKQALVKTDTSTTTTESEVKEMAKDIKEVTKVATEKATKEVVSMPVNTKKIPVDERLVQGKLANAFGS